MEKANPEVMKWPSNKTQYDKNWQKIFGCTACEGRGYFIDWCDIQKQMIQTTCILCNGTGKKK